MIENDEMKIDEKMKMTENDEMKIDEKTVEKMKMMKNGKWRMKIVISVHVNM
jgi:hypothetical protein